MNLSFLYPVLPVPKLIILILISTSIETHNFQMDESSTHLQKNSLFEYIYQLEGIPKLNINTNIKQLIRRKESESYQAADLNLIDKDENVLLSLTGKVRSRGNIRKKVSYLPPLKLDFKKSILDSLGFLKTDDLKLVLPGRSESHAQELLYKEFLLYEIYSLIDSNYLRTKLVDLKLSWKGKEKYQFRGFLIEEEEEYQRRKNLQIIERGKLVGASLEREPFLKMIFFQYMIANTDWSVTHKHNLEMVKLPSFDRVIAMPYDFDFSGFVGQLYANPHPVVPIENVHQRYFFPHLKMSETEFREMVDYYLSIEKNIYAICDAATYMKEKTIKESKDYLEDFFDLLRDSNRIRGETVKF